MNEPKSIYKDGKNIDLWRKNSKHKTPLDWRDELKEFDVLITKTGKLRVVRTVRYNPNGYLYSVEFVSLKPNRFQSPLAWYIRSDLKSLGFKKANLKYVVKGKDLYLQDAIKQGKTMGWDKEVSFKDVRQFA